MRPEIAMCIGGGSCVWDDVQALEKLYGREWDGLIIAVNDIGCHWPRRIDHWISLHAPKFPAWTRLRVATVGIVDSPRLWGKESRFDNEKDFCDEVLTPWDGGSSGMFAAQLALHLGCTKVVLCGIPMTPSPHFEQSQEGFGNRGWVSANYHWKYWLGLVDRFTNVRSMSGRTRELLGEPSLEWLNESPAT